MKLYLLRQACVKGKPEEKRVPGNQVIDGIVNPLKRLVFIMKFKLWGFESSSPPA
jgi:hypothetical protein